MVFVRSKKVKGRIYYQLVENYLENGKSVQKVIKHLGNEDKAKEYCREHKIKFTQKIEDKPIKGFFNSEREVAEFATALKGRKETPTKFIYLGKGAKLWKKLASSKTYNVNKIENKFLEKNSKEIMSEINSKFNIVDMGCGTGKNGSIIIKCTNEKFISKYCALDISREMLEQASSLLTKKYPSLNSEFHQLDFEEGNFAYLTENLREKNHKTNLLLLLTNTLGNVVDRSRVLTNIRESMTLNDYLLIGIELFDIKRTQNILEQYSKGSLVRNLVFNTLETYGINEKEGEWVVDFNTNKSQVEIRFVPKKDLFIKIGRRKITLKKNKSLLLAISYKATPKSLQLMLADSGFIIKRLFLVPNKDYAFVLCNPTQW